MSTRIETPPAVSLMEDIRIEGAREHNLKDISLKLPREHFIVVTGPSGSGKSSLAFDTIYAEGHRRYVESLSTYARQFLERVDKPDVDYIEGISPAIAIEQYNPVNHSRSTVGTASEIYDYLRLLFAKAGKIHCPDCGSEVAPATVDGTVALLLNTHENSRGFILFPLGEMDAEDLEGELKSLMGQGYVRVMVDDEIVNIGPQLFERLREESEPARPKAKRRGRPPKKKPEEERPAVRNHRAIRVVVDRLKFSTRNRARLGESLETAFREGDGVAEVRFVDGPRLRFSQRLECCGNTFEEPVPHTFSFNNPNGACQECGGFGNTLSFDEALIVPEPRKTLAQGAVEPWARPRYRRYFGEQLQDAARDEGLDIHTPWEQMPEDQKKLVFEGSGSFLGVYRFFERLKRRKYKVWVRVLIRRYQSLQKCASCNGTRLRPEALWIKLGDRTIADICAMPVSELREYFEAPPLTPDQHARAGDVLKQVRERLDFLHKVGLEYLTLDRETRTLSGGEHQRINLANQLGAHLTGTLYILDEPTIGLHPRDNARLVSILKDLVDRGNTLLVVEHDRDVIDEADHVVDLGPGAGERGGEVVFSGPREELDFCERSATAKFLSGEREISPRKIKRGDNGSCSYLSLLGAQENNLKKVDLHVPLGRLVAVTGVSGSGKSTLVHDTLYPALARILHDGKGAIGRFERIEGFEEIDSVVLLDQSPIGKSPRSNPITYLESLRRDTAPVRRNAAGEEHGLRPRAFLVQHPGGAVRVLHRNRHPEDRDALHGRHLHPLSRLRGQTLQAPGHGNPVQGQEHPRRAEPDGGRGESLFRSRALGAEQAADLKRRRTQLSPDRPAREHALGRRGPAPEDCGSVGRQAAARRHVPDGRADDGAPLSGRGAVAERADAPRGAGEHGRRRRAQYGRHPKRGVGDRLRTRGRRAGGPHRRRGHARGGGAKPPITYGQLPQRSISKRRRWAEHLKTPRRASASRAGRFASYHPVVRRIAFLTEAATSGGFPPAGPGALRRAKRRLALASHEKADKSRDFARRRFGGFLLAGRFRRLGRCAHRAGASYSSTE